MDNMETVEVDLTDEEFLHIAKLAHERDITFNQMVAKILQEEIDRLQKEENDKNRTST
jgi:predicted DNA-binding ribbon-helix-helix protein